MLINKKVRIGIAAVCMALCLFCVACAPTANEQPNEASSKTNVEFSENSLMAYHESMGQDITQVTEVSEESCSPCHGTLEEISDKTKYILTMEEYSLAGNPHENHLSETLGCNDCHSLTESSTLSCNSCHEWNIEGDNGTWN